MINDGVLAIVPARGNSKGILRKNIQLCAGRPLMEWTFQALAESKLVTKTVLSTDDPTLAHALNDQFQPEEIHRHAIISDTAQIEDRLDDDLKCHQAGYIVLLQPTSPVRTGKQIDEAIEHLQREGADSLVSVVQSHSFLWQQFSATGFSSRGNSLSYQPGVDVRRRRQDMEQYEENGSIYVFTREHWERTHNRLGGKISLYEMPEYCKIQVDTPFDLWIAEQILVRQQRHNMMTESILVC
jgi:CMP-N,N'-diacetyllegionaminic acid synthase